jgi:hypothetical protein
MTEVSFFCAGGITALLHARDTIKDVFGGTDAALAQIVAIPSTP